MSVIDFIGHILGFNDQIESLTFNLSTCKTKGEELEKIINSLNESIRGLNRKNTVLRNEITYLSDKLAKYEEGIANDVNMEEVEKYYHEKYPVASIKYAGRSFPIDPNTNYPLDVRYFFQHSKPLVEMVSKLHLDTGNYDSRALACLKWVKDNIKYFSDISIFGSKEYWSFPCETLYSLKGDCDSGAILLANLMVESGIPYWRIRLNVGFVEGGYHMYVTYCRETDNQFVVLDWCYWYNSAPVKDRPMHKDERNYYKISFSFNRDYAYGEMDTMACLPEHFITNVRR